MPGGFPLGYGVCNGQSIGAVTASSVGTSVTAGTSNGKGSWAQLIASTSYDIVLLQVSMKPNSAARYLVDIGVGGSGSEKVIISNLQANVTLGADQYLLPITIPSGSRISARCQSSTNSGVITVSAIGWDGSGTLIEGVISGYDDIGTVTSGNSTGTTITASGTTNTLGSYTQLVASTAKDYIGIIPAIVVASAAVDYLANISIGASGSEQIICPNIYVRSANASFLFCPGIIPIQIPSGTRIAANCQCSTASDTLVLVIYGAYE